MYFLELIQSVRLITDVCLEVAPGENVLCITDGEEGMEVITLVAAELYGCEEITLCGDGKRIRMMGEGKEE